MQKVRGTSYRLIPSRSPPDTPLTIHEVNTAGSIRFHRIVLGNDSWKRRVLRLLHSSSSKYASPRTRNTDKHVYELRSLSSVSKAARNWSSYFAGVTVSFA